MNRDSIAEINVTIKTRRVSLPPPSLSMIFPSELVAPVICSATEIIDIPSRVMTAELLKPEKDSSGLMTPERPRETITISAMRSARSLFVISMATAMTIIMEVMICSVDIECAPEDA